MIAFVAALVEMVVSVVIIFKMFTGKKTYSLDY